MNHISFQNFHYQAAVDPSEHTGDACPCDTLKPVHSKVS